jgi:hypothetical protein
MDGGMDSLAEEERNNHSELVADVAIKAAISFSAQMPAPPCCIQREAGEAFALFFAVFALNPTAFSKNREEEKVHN